MINFLDKIVSEGLARPDADEFQDYSFPAGSLTSPVLQLLSRPPKKPGQQEWGDLHGPFCHFDSLDFVAATFPDFDEDLIHDLFCKQVYINNEEGERKSNGEVCPSPELRKLHEDFTKELLEASQAKVIIAYGRPVRKWFERTFDIHAGACEIIYDVMIGDIEVSRPHDHTSLAITDDISSAPSSSSPTASGSRIVLHSPSSSRLLTF